MRRPSMILVVLALIVNAGLSLAGTLIGTAFTYQGQLKQNGNPYGARPTSSSGSTTPPPVAPRSAETRNPPGGRSPPASSR